jgi:aryl-alcohol dehydrogenase-like predicted oxidoreductase
VNRRTLGRTGLAVSEVVFGGGWVGGLLIDADEATKRRAIRRALDAGINWIDTAAMYGEGRSEEAIGRLLGEIQDKPHVSTKVVVDARAGDAAGQVERGVAASLKRLRRDSVDLLFLHNAVGGTTDEGAVSADDVLRAGGIADALDAVRRKGMTRFVGFTALGDTAACLRVVASGRFDAAQVYYNLLNPSAALAPGHRFPGQDFAGLLAACRRHGVGVMAIRVLAAGVLATTVRHGREGAITADTALADEEARARAAFALLGADEAGATPHGTMAQAALRYVLANDDIAGAVVGMATLDHLEQVLAAVAMGPLPAPVHAALDARYS